MASGYLGRHPGPSLRTDGFIAPCIPSRATKAPVGPDSVHETERYPAKPTRWLERHIQQIEMLL